MISDRDQPGTPADIVGDYTLTMTASSSCSLPSALMRRTYQAQILRFGTDFLVQLSGADMLAFFDGFLVRREGTTVGFDLGVGGNGMVEYIAGVGYLGYSGTATGTIGDRQIAATLRGGLALMDDNMSVGANCQATDHRMEFVRR